MNDIDVLERADAAALRLTRRPRTWPTLVDEWAKFVQSVEDGYRFTLYDYHNDLDVRGTIEQVLGQFSDDEAASLAAPVRILDARFVAATREGSEIVVTYDRGFWARRVPLKAVGELATDLAERSRLPDGEEAT